MSTLLPNDHGELMDERTGDDLRDAVNETSGTAADTLRKALSRSEEEEWRGVIVLALADDNGGRFLCSSALNDMELAGLLRWATLLADDQVMRDLSEPEEAL